MIKTETFMDIISLHWQGLSMRAIAKKLGIHRNTVKKHIEERKFPQYRKTKRQESILDQFRQTIDDFLAEDDYQATWILERIKKMGYSGSYENNEELGRNAFSDRLLEGVPGEILYDNIDRHYNNFFSLKQKIKLRKSPAIDKSQNHLFVLLGF